MRSRRPAEFPLGELIIPSHRDPIEAEQAEDKTLVVVTMPGLEASARASREGRVRFDRYTQPLLHLGAFFSAGFIYGRDRGVRKNVMLDENSLMARRGSGRAFFLRLSRDSRKWDTLMIISGSANSTVDGCGACGAADQRRRLLSGRKNCWMRRRSTPASSSRCLRNRAVMKDPPSRRTPASSSSRTRSAGSAR